MYTRYKMTLSDVKREDGTVVKIGDRLICDGQVATVRFHGEVPPTQGDWLGVEWDNPERGKHNGTHEGRLYFKTKHEKSGSFIRAKKANLGISLLAAINSRYGRIEEENAGVITEELYVVGASNQQTVVEMVGARKVNDLQSKIEDLTEIVLRGEPVYGSPNTDDLGALVPSIVNLDISQTLVSSWKQVADVAVQLKNLRSLNVSENKLELPHSPGELIDKFSHVKVLFLNRMAYTWTQVIQCSAMFSHLEQVHACYNGIDCLSEVKGQLESVTMVNLESNSLADWSQVLKLSHLPNLRTLILSENRISSIVFPSNGVQETEIFPQLKSLSINGNNIGEWTSINELNKLAGLEKLQFHRNPLMDSATPETVRQLMIAKLKHLKFCNRTEVTVEERKGAEIDYLKRFGQDWVKAGGHQDPNINKCSPEFRTQHPRYQDLIDKWEAPEDSEMQSKQSVSLKNSLINVKISCPEMPDQKVLEKKVPSGMTVGKLKALISRLLKPDSPIQQLCYISQKMVGHEIELDSDQRFLSYYSIEPGDTVIAKLEQ